MLKQRVLTAIILIPIFILLVLKLSPQSFCIFTGLLVLWAAFEWSALMEVKTLRRKLIYPILMFFMLFFSLWIKIPNVIYAAVVWWVFASLFVFRFPNLSAAWGRGVVVRGLMGCLVLIPCWLALNFIRNSTDGPYTLLFLFALIWSADIGAYFAGKKWGKTKLAALVSPGKSWQGVFGGLLVSLLVTLLTLLVVDVPYYQWIGIVSVAIATVAFSVMGDLFESMLKRKAGLKDSGQLLPGHGGLLDRIDSLTAAAPIFVAGALILEHLAK